MRYSFFLSLITAIVAVYSARAKVSLASVFSDHVVLQQQKDIVIWGWSAPGEKLSVTIAPETGRNGKASASTIRKGKVTASKDGKWIVTMPAMPAGGPYTMVVKGRDETVTVNDIMVGEVWICSGQSNMEFTMRSVNNAEKEISGATNSMIRSFDVVKDMSRFPALDVKGQWLVSSPETVAGFSAVAYLFAREIADSLKIPVGIVNASWGGTDIESWMSMEAIDVFPKYKRIMKRLRSEELEDYLRRSKEIEAEFKKAISLEPGIPEKWYDTTYDKSQWDVLRVPGLWTDDRLSGVDGVVWTTTEIDVPERLAGREAMLSLGIIDDDDETWLNGYMIGATAGYDIKRLYRVPEGVLKAGKNQLTVKIIDNHGGGGCYGASDLYFLQVGNERLSILDNDWRYKVAVDNEAFEYVEDGPNAFPSRLFNAMVSPLTSFAARGFLWYQGENNAPRAEEYYRLFPAMIRDWRKQWRDEAMPFYWVQLANYMMADDKPSVSQWAVLRDAQNAALALPYTGQAVIIDAGDADDIHPRDKQTVGNRLARLALHNDYGFRNVACDSPQPLSATLSGKDIELTFTNVEEGLVAHDKYGYLCGFSVADRYGKHHWVKAVITAPDKVVLDASGIDTPKQVRYAWADNPDDANLFNSANLPSTPFEMDVK